MPTANEYLIEELLNQAISSRRMPPTIQDVKIYFSQKGVPEPEAETFFLLHEKRQWTTRTGNCMAEWKRAARRWIGTIIENQRCFSNYQPIRQIIQ